jgi:Fur family transcriptional regulator, stress-responsive regulator
MISPAVPYPQSYTTRRAHLVHRGCEIFVTAAARDRRHCRRSFTLDDSRLACCDERMSSDDLLRSRGLRVTRPRLAVLDILAGGGHLEVDEIARRVRDRLDSVSTQAVYDVLSALSRAGLARRIEPAGSPARYEWRAGDNHHHVVCRSCGQIADIDCAEGEAPCLDPDTTHGFEIDEAEVTFWGLCPGCQSRRAADD